jgi:hypothetical protein
LGREGFGSQKHSYCFAAFTAASLFTEVEEDTVVLDVVSPAALTVLFVVDFTLPAVCRVFEAAVSFVF